MKRFHLHPPFPFSPSQPARPPACVVGAGSIGSPHQHQSRVWPPGHTTRPFVIAQSQVMVTSFSIFLAFILWAGTLVSSNVTWQNTTFPEPLQWSNTLPFQTFPIVSDASNSLDLIFSSAPLLRHRKVTKQRQLKVFSQNIDLTSVALKVHNRRRDISLLLENHVRLASVFIPAYRSKQEYLLESRPMSYHDCSTFCADFSE